jgi:zinc protease
VNGRRYLSAALLIAAIATLPAAARSEVRGFPELQAAPPAQGMQQSTKGVVPKNRAPVSKDILRVKLPVPEEVTLPNGAHLMVLEDRRAPQVSVQIYMPGAGGYFDPPGLSGLATFTATQMREGTKQWSTTALNEELEKLAASVSVSTGLSSSEAVLSLSALPEHLDHVMGIAADVLLNPTFPAEEFERYKQRTRASLMQQRSFPGFLLQETANRVMYGDHPAGRISASLEALDKATRDDLVRFHQAHYVPDHAAIAVTGDISMAEARALIDATLGAWKKANTPVPETVDPKDPGPPAVHFIARPGSVQTNLFVAAPGITRTHRDYDVLSVMNKIIGGGPTGRLFLNLREEKSYTYGAYSGLSAGMYRGIWSASTDVRTDVTDPALTDLLAEVTRMREEKVPAEEFETQKRSMVASFALSLESPQSIMSYHLTRWRYKLPMDYWDRQPQRIMAVTADQVQAAAREYLDPAKLQIVAVGDAATIAEVLAKHGSVVKYDTEGKVIK